MYKCKIILFDIGVENWSNENVPAICEEITEKDIKNWHVKVKSYFLMLE